MSSRRAALQTSEHDLLMTLLWQCHMGTYRD